MVVVACVACTACGDGESDVGAYGSLQVIVAPNGACRLARGTGNTLHAVGAAYGALTGEGKPQQRAPGC